MRQRAVDLNADLGEEVTDDPALLQVVTSANVACGYHAGTPSVMRAACELAIERSVTLGAQVSYADRANFGRVVVDVAPSVLAEQVADQVGVLTEVARAAGGAVAYLKPHGALYHRAASDEATARAVLSGSGALPVLGMPGSTLLSLAAASGRATRHEGFPDRGYTPAGTLVPRSEPGALVTDSAAIAARAVELAGSVDSVCVHGDSPDAVRHAIDARRALSAAGFVVTTCWSDADARPTPGRQ
ncbi:5-oxoprolinase subunit PxpA [Nocardioides sp.]|uniref:5-oxoprolinase subunit PxpA n=1 Tax=Nocardioides sp. TaxID=35761 RepID=UPI002CA1EBF7|nr:5-oxoprolinase subunit PxpA [Nocardioides sp.]HXH79130.1 5-oxoprolinase subunit PxpA [Nocardioides sp.]